MRMLGRQTLVTLWVFVVQCHFFLGRCLSLKVTGGSAATRGERAGLLSSFFDDEAIVLHPGVSVSEDAHGGLGVFATQPLRLGETLMTIPGSATISARDAKARDSSLATFPETIALAAHLCRLRSERTTCSPYVSAVFESVARHPLVLEDACAASMPRALRTELAELRTECSAAATLVPTIPSSTLLAAIAVVLSRSFAYATAATLVPALDLLNHDATPNVSHEQARDGTTLVTARIDLEPGAELLNQYLPPGAADAVYYSRFGFLPARDASR